PAHAVLELTALHVACSHIVREKRSIEQVVGHSALATLRQKLTADVRHTEVIGTGAALTTLGCGLSQEAVVALTHEALLGDWLQRDPRNLDATPHVLARPRPLRAGIDLLVVG